MSSFADNIRPHVDAELRAAAAGGPDAFAHLERAHVLGQESTREHVRVHWRMLRWGLARRDAREVIGQVFRLIGAATKTFVGLVPAGNTGGANVSPFEPMTVDPQLAAIIEKARRASSD
jgi:hypothetical protein